MFPTLQSYGTTRIHYPNIRSFFLKTIVLLRLSAIVLYCIVLPLYVREIVVTFPYSLAVAMDCSQLLTSH